MTRSLFSPDFWTDDVLGNAIPAMVGFCIAQGWRLGHAFYRQRRSRGAFWGGLRDGLTFVFVSEQQTRDDLRAQMTIADNCAGLGVKINPDLHYADQNLERVLSNNLVVIHTGVNRIGDGSPTSSLLRGWLNGWTGATDRFDVFALFHNDELFHDDEIAHDSAESGAGYLVRLPNPHRPERSIMVLSGPRTQSAWAVALWMCDPKFSQDPYVASGDPFVHRVTFGLTQGVPFVKSVSAEYLVRPGQDSRT